MIRMDLHMHSTVSDGTDTPQELLRLVREAGLGLFALTDHDAVKGCAMILGARRDGDPELVTGVEFSCRDEEGKYHILGYNYDPEGASIREVVELGHRYRMSKCQKRLDFIRNQFGFAFRDDDVQRLLALDNPGKPHIGNLMVEYGYAPSKESAIRDYLNRGLFPDEYVHPGEAIRGILGSGGIPVLAHPAYGSGDDLILGPQLDSRIRRLAEMGLQGLEAFYSGFHKDLIAKTLSLAEKYHLYVTAGSDYHGGNKPLIRLGSTGLDEAETVPDGVKRFLEAIKKSSPRGAA